MIIKAMLLPKGASNKPNKAMVPKYITVHNTDNTHKGATAEAHARFQLNGSGGISKSWHYTVDDQAIYQHLQDLEQGWHAGDGVGTGNTQSIGIEICMYEGMDEAQAWRLAAELIASLMTKHSIPLQNVVPHQRWSGKACPSRLLPHWDKFVEMIKQAQQPDKPSKPDNSVTVCIDGKPVRDGLMIGGVTYVPARAVCEAIGGKIVWDPKKVRVDMFTNK